MITIEKKCRKTGKVIAYCYGEPSIGLVSLHVEKEYRRKGMGRDLMLQYIEAVSSHSKEDNVRFECHKDNEPALALYKSLGFSVLESREDDETVIMIRYF